MQKLFILWWLMLILIVCNTFVTLNINIAIVSMVRTQHIHNETTSLETSNIVCPNTSFSLIRDYIGSSDSSATTTEILPETVYDWSEADQIAVLSGYYWLNYISIMPGGILSHKYGSKTVAGIAQLVSSAMSSLIPIAAGYGARAVFWIRAVQGILSFMSVPAGLFSIIGNWCPPQERAKFGAGLLTGSGVGMALGSFIFGYIGQYLHWKWIFHFTSVCGIIWSVFWYFLIYDSPQQHPTITIEEKKYLENNLKDAIGETKTAIPWKGIITSVPLLICILTVAFFTWGWTVTMTYMPKYLQSFYGLTSNEIGIITGVSCFLSSLLPLGIAYYCDLVIEKKILTMTGCRKFCNFWGGLASMIPLLIIAFTNCNLTVVIVCLMIHTATKTIPMFGAQLSIMDMSPKFCGILEGFTGTSSFVFVFLISATLNYFTPKYEAEWLWKMVFLWTASCVILVSVLFSIFGSSEVQEWNYKDDTFSKKCTNKRNVA